jgi:hypothetical protein
MKTPHVIPALLSLALLAAACPKKPTEPAKKEVVPEAAGLPVDTEYASGTIEAAVMDVKTRLDLPSLAPEGTVSEEVKKAQEASVTTQSLMVSDHRGKMAFTTENFFVPRGTELRYSPSSKKYVFTDPGKKLYWALSGSEIGGLLEGGPAISRKSYSMKITDTEEKESVAGFATVKSDAELGFDWSVKTKAGPRQGKVKVKLAIWHTADTKLKPSWGKMMVDFLTVPFQDAEGQKVVDELKSKVKFPLKWSMEVIPEGQARAKGEAPPKLLTAAEKLEIRSVPRADLASPPTGFSAASRPYEFVGGGQTMKEELLGKLPARQEAPPEGKK